MTYELLIQHQGAVMLPPVVESVSIEWERQGQPGKLTADIVKTSGLSFQEGDPCRFSVDGTPIFYGFVFEKARKGSMDQVMISSTTSKTRTPMCIQIRQRRRSSV